ncbi:BT_3987 domain-containing protein [Prevotella melaninogenica]
MKYNISKLFIGAVAMASLILLASCENAEYSPLSNQAYIAQTNTNGNSSQNITIGTSAVTSSVNVRLSDLATQDYTFEVVSDTTALAEYNQRNETSYKPLPATLYSLSSNEVKIEKGKSVSSDVTLTINPLTQALKDSGQKYAVALRLKSKDGKYDVLNSGSSMVYVLDQVVYQAVPIINATHNIHFSMRQTYDLSQWTVEMNVNISKLGTALGELNNQTLFGAWGNDGGEIYTRFGDAPIEGNRLQIKTQGTQMNSKQLFNANQWYHLAFVCTGTKLYLYVNGALDNSMDLPGKATNLSNRFNFGNTDYLKANVMVSELRFWTVARTQAQIANNMYACDPKSTDLEAYWKLNEGQGDTFKDATGHNNTGKCVAVPTWEQNVRIDGK